MGTRGILRFCSIYAHFRRLITLFWETSFSMVLDFAPYPANSNLPIEFLIGWNATCGMASFQVSYSQFFWETFFLMVLDFPPYPANSTLPFEFLIGWNATSGMVGFQLSSVSALNTYNRYCYKTILYTCSFSLMPFTDTCSDKTWRAWITSLTLDALYTSLVM